MEVDPRLQLSDLTDYQFQTSLSQYGAYNTPGLNQSGYFQHIPLDEGRSSSLRTTQLSSRDSPTTAQNERSQNTPNVNLSGLYQRTSIPDVSRGFNPGRTSSNGSEQLRSNLNFASTKNAGLTVPNRSGTVSKPRSQSNEEEVQDPTVFVAPHLLATPNPNPPSLRQWREKFFNIDEPLLLTSYEYLTYFPHVDNIYSHRSTQKYKRKPFVSHYWDCRLKGRPTGTPMKKGETNSKQTKNGEESEKKKRKRKTRERDLCDVKIKVTEFFGTEDLEALRKLGLGPDAGGPLETDTSDLTFVLNGQQKPSDGHDSTFGILEPAQNHAPGHPGYGGKKWYMVQRINGNDKDGEDDGDDRDLDHKHTMEESDRIKKSSVQRWLLAREKQKKKVAKDKIAAAEDEDESNDNSTPSTAPSRFHATGFALQTLYSHTTPTSNGLTFYSSSFCPFAQRVWIALEFIGIPYQYVEITEHHWYTESNSAPTLAIPELKENNPDGKVPCILHSNFAVWESLVILEYLEDLALGQSLFQPAVGNPQLKAHSRLWVDFINRRILPVFYALILLPDEADGTNTNDVTALTAVVKRNSHANPDASRLGGFNDESYRMQPPGQTYMPGLNSCDPSSLPPRTLSHSPNHRPEFNEKLQSLLTTLRSTITMLVNASHRTGPFFLGPILSYVDIAFAPWIIRLSRVLSYYRGFPRPEVGTRWQAWCDAVENNEIVKRTVSEEQTYRDVYSGLNSNTWEYDDRGRVNYTKARQMKTNFPEMDHARKIVETEGFGLGGDVWGRMVGEDWTGRGQ